MYYHNPDVQNEIRKRAKEGRVIFSDHGNEQSEYRDIEDLDILSCLKIGILEGEDWKAKIGTPSTKKQPIGWLKTIVSVRG